MNKKLIAALSLLFAMVVLTSCSTSTQERRAATGLKRDEFKLYAACDSADDTVTAIFMRDFAKRVEEKTGGKVKVETYSNAQIGGDSEILEACQNGNISFVFQTTAPQVPYVKQAAILDAPMAFKNLEIARNVLDGKLMEQLNPYYEKKGLELLAIADQSFREMTSNKKIEKIQDLKGIKIRTMENPYHIQFWKLVGANPTPMSYSEVYIGLQQGTIDAQENPLEAIIGPKFYEQQDYLIMTNHIIHSVTCTASTAVLNSLPKEYQDEIRKAALESKDYARNQTDKRFASREKIIIDSGTQIIPFNDQLFTEMNQAGRPVWNTLKHDIGKDLIDTLQSEITRSEKEYNQAHLEKQVELTDWGK